MSIKSYIYPNWYAIRLSGAIGRRRKNRCTYQTRISVYPLHAPGGAAQTSAWMASVFTMRPHPGRCSSSSVRVTQMDDIQPALVRAKWGRTGGKLSRNRSTRNPKGMELRRRKGMQMLASAE
jgi:hypothetical protein